VNRLRERAAGSVGLLQICLAGVLWGTGGLAVQLIRHLTPLSPLTISVYRTGIATVVMFGATVWARGLHSVAW
jgi:drug/metabolite transporter, DME family